MSLIPSESASFPDLLGRGLGASKKSKWRISDEISLPPAAPPPPKVKPVVKPAAKAQPQPKTEKTPPVSEPLVKPKAEIPPAEVPPAPKPAPAPVTLPPAMEVAEPVHAPIPIVRIPRSIANRAGEGKGVDPEPEVTKTTHRLRPAIPSQPAIPPPRTPLAKPRLRPRPTLHPRYESEAVSAESMDSAATAPQPRAAIPASPAPASEKPAASLHFTPAGSDDEAEEFGFPEAAAASPIQRRRRARLLRFALCELFALMALAGAVTLGLAHRLPEDPVSLMAKIATILSAIAVAVIPIVFYGLPETLPRSNR